VQFFLLALHLETNAVTVRLPQRRESGYTVTRIRDRFGGSSMDTPLSKDSIVIASSDQVSCELGDESVILSLRNSVYYGVDPVGASVWKLLKQQRSVGELRDAMMEEYEVESRRCEADLLVLLEKMRAEGLVKVIGTVTESA
jgi:hypothetical protein